MKTHKQFVYATIYRYIGNYDDTEDVTQEVFIKMFSKLKKFKKTSSLKTWLYRIAVNTALNHLRKNKRSSLFVGSESPEFDKIAEDEQSEERLDHIAFEKDFKAAVAELPEKQRETFVLRHFENLPYSQISEMLGTSQGGLKANYHQALKKLATMLKKYNPKGGNDE